jgi:hypothetical protein
VECDLELVPRGENTKKKSELRKTDGKDVSQKKDLIKNLR